MRKLILAAALTLAALPAGAVTLAGVNIPDHTTVNNQTLVLNGAGIRKKLFIKVYTGALYLPAKQSNAAALLSADTPRRMVMHFVFGVGKGKIAEAWEEGLEDNTPNASAEVKNAFKTLSSWMEDVEDGQEIVLTYIPGTGTLVEVKVDAKGRLVKGTLPGKAVADAILSTWIGPKPGPGNDFKNAVLGAK